MNGKEVKSIFVLKSFDILNSKGYLSFVHPLGWRKTWL